MTSFGETILLIVVVIGILSNPWILLGLGVIFIGGISYWIYRSIGRNNE